MAFAPADGRPLYMLSGVAREYRQGRQCVAALRDVSLRVGAGEFLAIAGPSGSGKTTLLGLLGLLDSPSAGRIALDGVDVTHLTEGQRTRIRRDQIGFVFQSFELLPVLTARENVEYALLKRGLGQRDARARVEEMLAAVGLVAEADRRPTDLSGGQQQRVALARALVREPRVVLADEPTSALDHASGLAVIDLMKRVNRERGVTFVFSTHDPRVLAAADRVVPLEDGRLAS